MAERGAPLGNTNGEHDKPWQRALKRALARSQGEFDKGLNLIADRVVAAAQEGDRDAWKEIAERLDGKAPQGIQLSGDPDRPVAIHVTAIDGKL